jgi:hypothetical protein
MMFKISIKTEENRVLRCGGVDIVLTDVSEERIASVFTVEEKRKSASEEPA